MFVANKRGDSLSRIDLTTGRETHRVDTCANPHELAVSPDGQALLVGCYSGSTVNIHDTGDLSLMREIELGGRARVHSAVWLGDGSIVAGAEGRGSLFFTSPIGSYADPELSEIGTGGPGPHMVAVNGEGTQAWGTIIPSGSVVRYDLERGVEAERMVLGDQTEALALSPDGRTLWIGSNTGNVVYRLDAQNLQTQAEIPVGQVPIRIAAHPDGNFVATSNFGDGSISVIDTSTNDVVRTIEVSGDRSAVQVTLVFSPDGERLYAAETADDVIAEIDFASGEVLRRLKTGAGGDGLAVTN
jgi:YVTN family beta-propeller protein